ncbi:ribbon-helix-helix domain-containing protein [Shewanella profunda]|uniref:ribbon-helix-helix domain-containing protein n=1 Tax=Shewanella profunda TaxID=254793 RepID=UPI00200D7273|nr:ribbon-helix-helix domain-containing protein [Shewanella profunda]MCL1089500.1 ribbon-helix-helix domain-containing protein [Shewanella profunda]
MSLTDLKRKKPKQIITPVSVDDFIEDANNYALGKASQLIVPPASISKGLDKKSVKIYRHATFSLTETSISQLDTLSKETKIAKSRLLRILIDEFSQRSMDEQYQLLHKNDEDS